MSLGLAGAALTTVGATSTWAEATSRVTGVRSASADGTDVAPLVLPLALVALAAWGTVLVLRRRGRRVVTVLAALAGLIFAARLNTATPKAGVSFELDVIAAVFIGGASMSGGVGRIVGAVTGAFIMGVMNNGMSIMGIGIDYQQVIKGLVLLAAVFFDVYNKNREV